MDASLHERAFEMALNLKRYRKQLPLRSVIAHDDGSFTARFTNDGMPGPLALQQQLKKAGWEMLLHHVAVPERVVCVLYREARR